MHACEVANERLDLRKRKQKVGQVIPNPGLILWERRVLRNPLIAASSQPGALVAQHGHHLASTVRDIIASPPRDLQLPSCSRTERRGGGVSSETESERTTSFNIAAWLEHARAWWNNRDKKETNWRTKKASTVRPCLEEKIRFSLSRKMTINA